MRKYREVRAISVVFQLVCMACSASAGGGQEVRPVADAGPDQHISFANGLVTLDASGSRLHDPQAATYAWSQVSGPIVTLVNSGTASPTFVPVEEGEYGFQLVVGEGTDWSEPDEVVVWVGFVPTQPALDEWPVEKGGNGHWYQPVCYKGTAAIPGISWLNAECWAELGGGYLATIGSEQENDFAFGLADARDDYWFEIPSIPAYWFGPWLGGYQEPGSAEPNEGWKWITGELFDYNAWYPGEPSGIWEGKNEDVLQYFTVAKPGQSRCALWNDAYDGSGARHPNGFIVEYDVVLREAEYPSVLDRAEVGDSIPGFTGIGYVTFSDQEGSAARWDISLGPAGLRRLTLRFANGTDRVSFLRIGVNDLTVRSQVELPPTGAWDAWENLALSVPFRPGVNALRVTLLGGPGPAIDSIGVVGENTNLALGKAINFSSQDSIQAVAAAVDGDCMTSWVVREFPQWIEVDLGDVYVISQSHVVATGVSEGKVKSACQFEIAAKDVPSGSYLDCVNERDNTSYGPILSPISDSLGPVVARYVRLTVTGDSLEDPNGVAIREFRVFGTVDSN